MTQRDRDDESLRAALSELRAGDQRVAPSFDAVMTRRSSRGATPRVSLRTLAVAAAVILAAGLGYRAVSARRERLTVPSQVLALSAWRPATDVLLEVPIKRLLRHAPRLGASLIDISISGDIP